MLGIDAAIANAFRRILLAEVCPYSLSPSLLPQIISLTMYIIKTDCQHGKYLPQKKKQETADVKTMIK